MTCSLMACSATKPELIKAEVITDEYLNDSVETEDTVDESIKELIDNIPEDIENIVGSDQEISDNWEDLEVKIDGNLIKLPCSYKEFEKIGWKIDRKDHDKDELKLEPYEDSFESKFIRLNRDGYEECGFYVTIINDTDSVIDIENGTVTDLQIDKFYGFEIRLPQSHWL